MNEREKEREGEREREREREREIGRDRQGELAEKRGGGGENGKQETMTVRVIY